MTATSSHQIEAREATARWLPTEDGFWGFVFVLPLIAVLIAFVAFPIGYGFWLAADLQAFVRVWNDPVYARAAWNTALFLFFAVNLKLMAALLLACFFAQASWWRRALFLVFLLPWATPTLASVLSIRWMFDPDWGLVNMLLERIPAIGPVPWLSSPLPAFILAITVHIWKFLPFWTVVLLASRLSIPQELYEASQVDGATPLQQFRYVTLPSIAPVYLTSLLLSLAWTLGDFNSVYLLTGGGPTDSTHVLATLGIRYAFRIGDISAGVATVVTALPFMLPILILLMRRLSRTS